MRGALAALALLMAATAGAADRPTPATPTQCLNRARRDFGDCQRRVREQCRNEFDQALRGCFAENSGCLQKCQDEDRECRVEPDANLASCRAGCAATLKSASLNCPTTGDAGPRCIAAARERALKCRQRCSEVVGPSKERCIGTYKDCLTACAQPH